jgi:Undecaprenyl-phosphate galactose phosphotransferase WbaP
MRLTETNRDTVWSIPSPELLRPPSVIPGRTGLLNPLARRCKRCCDILCALLLGALALLPMALIALAIVLESSGPAFFRHTRLGKGHRRIRIWKFRTMVDDAALLLQAHLEQDPRARLEWARVHKLRKDPRITRAGRLLRRSSLDELPQLWNVLRGEMSLVGPRPITQDEVARYGSRFTLYSKVRPGLTGLWQVSGRNDTDYQTRVNLDCAYIRNWTPWLDLKICARTVLVMLQGRGAY